MIALPPGYVDRTPRRGAWRDPAKPPAPYSWPHEILLADGETTNCIHDGLRWWQIAEMHPIAWRPINEVLMGGRSDTTLGTLWQAAPDI